MLTKIFCEIDDFVQFFDKQFNPHLLPNGKRKENRGLKPSLSPSEIITIMIKFHTSNYRTFKFYYNYFVVKYLSKAFPNLVSYNRFVELQKSVFIYLFAYLVIQGKGKTTGISFVDSTPIRVCHNRRILSHKVFDGIAGRGKSSTGWFYGFKLHLIVNEKGEILKFSLTSGNTNDRNPLKSKSFIEGIFGKLVGDKGYISKELNSLLSESGIELITKVRKNMKARVVNVYDKLLLRKRAVIESINDQLKNISQIEHSRHRSPNNFLVNLFSGLIAYCFKEKKPSVNIDFDCFLGENQTLLIQ